MSRILEPTGLENKTSDELQEIIFEECMKGRTDLYRAACREDQRRYRARQRVLRDNAVQSEKRSSYWTKTV